MRRTALRCALFTFFSVGAWPAQGRETGVLPAPTSRSWGVTPRVKGAGELSCVALVAHGEDSLCWVTPGSGKRLSRLTDGGRDVTTMVRGGTYTLQNVRGPRSVTVTFETVPPAARPPPLAAR